MQLELERLSSMTSDNLSVRQLTRNSKLNGFSFHRKKSKTVTSFFSKLFLVPQFVRCSHASYTFLSQIQSILFSCAFKRFLEVIIHFAKFFPHLVFSLTLFPKHYPLFLSPFNNILLILTTFVSHHLVHY